MSIMVDERKLGIGEYLRALREARNQSLREVAELSGVSNAFISQIESGKVRQPSPATLYKLAECYGVPYETLMERAGYPVPQGGVRASKSASNVFQRLGTINEEEEQALLDYLAFLRSKSRREGRR